MTTDELAKHYGSPPKAYKELGISRQLWNSWRRDGIPVNTQSTIQIKLNGALMAGEKKPAKKRKAK